jgi:hypothetical protein
MSSAAVELFLQSAFEKVELHLDSTIIAETTFVLISLYQQSQPEVGPNLR